MMKATDVDLKRGRGPFPPVDDWYLGEIGALLLEAKPLDLPDVKKDDQLTQDMTALREAPLSQRFEVYREQRAINQRDWYNNRARSFRKYRDVWRVITVLVYFVGAGLVVAHAISPLRNAVPFGLLGANYWPLVAAVASAITGYVAARHYDDLQQTYRYMSGLLTAEIDVMRKFNPTTDTQAEADFAEQVDRVETLMDAEHKQWHKLV